MVVGSDVDMVEEELVAASTCGLHILVGGGGVSAPPPPPACHRDPRTRIDPGRQDRMRAIMPIHLYIQHSLLLSASFNYELDQVLMYKARIPKFFISPSFSIFAHSSSLI
jgi:hypothetical protein